MESIGDQVKKLPETFEQSTGEEELTLYDLRTNYFITFWTKKSKELMNALELEKFDKIKSGEERQKRSQEIMKMIMSTPCKQGEVSKPKIKNLGKLQFEPTVWEGEKAQKVFLSLIHI